MTNLLKTPREHGKLLMEYRRTQIEEILPHRGQLLFPEWVRVLEGNHYIGLVTWSSDQAGIAGHFPGMPIVPAVFIVEAAAQIAGLGLLSDLDEHTRGTRLGMLAGVRRCTFTRPVRPHQHIEFDLYADRSIGEFVGVKGEARLGDSKVATIEIVLATAPISMIKDGLMVN